MGRAGDAPYLSTPNWIEGLGEKGRPALPPTWGPARPSNRRGHRFYDGNGIPSIHKKLVTTTPKPRLHWPLEALRLFLPSKGLEQSPSTLNVFRKVVEIVVNGELADVKSPELLQEFHLLIRGYLDLY